MMSCHLIPMWYEWNMNAGDVMVTWFAAYVNLRHHDGYVCHVCHVHAWIVHVLSEKWVHLSIQMAWWFTS